MYLLFYLQPEQPINESSSSEEAADNSTPDVEMVVAAYALTELSSESDPVLTTTMKKISKTMHGLVESISNNETLVEEFYGKCKKLSDEITICQTLVKDNANSGRSDMQEELPNYLIGLNAYKTKQTFGLFTEEGLETLENIMEGIKKCFNILSPKKLG